MFLSKYAQRELFNEAIKKGYSESEAKEKVKKLNDYAKEKFNDQLKLFGSKTNIHICNYCKKEYYQEIEPHFCDCGCYFFKTLYKKSDKCD